ncbi:hypothetical protein Zmor_000348 [Zophobas morio]|uniref:Uncharacterized protein n=1 Tax=Zophobas morio TaxID=2755281 RepID=A0AA38MNH8_9CUCU|nr:hypothetical protein Zmor_000348 [Zophobas morio]
MHWKDSKNEEVIFLGFPQCHCSKSLNLNQFCDMIQFNQHSFYRLVAGALQGSNLRLNMSQLETDNETRVAQPGLRHFASCKRAFSLGSAFRPATRESPVLHNH